MIDLNDIHVLIELLQSILANPDLQDIIEDCSFDYDLQMFINKLEEVLK